MSNYKPIRTFFANEGDWSVDEAGPEALKFDFDVINKMFDPTATHSDGQMGGIGFGNLNFSFEDSSFADLIGVVALEYLGSTNTLQAQLYKIVEKLQTHDSMFDYSRSAAETAEAYAVGKRNNVDVAIGDPAYHNNAKYYAEFVADNVSNLIEPEQIEGTRYKMVINTPAVIVTPTSLETAKISMDTSSNWSTRTDYVPKEGEIIIYTDRNEVDELDYPGVKIGDGMAYVVDLPFVGDEIANDITSALEATRNDTEIHVTNAERTNWNSKLNYEIDGELLSLKSTST